MQFKECPVIADKVSKVVAWLANKQREDILPLVVIEELTGCHRYTDSWGTIIKKIRRRLLNERHIALLTERSVGYRLCNHGEQLYECSKRRQRRARRQLSSAILEVGALPIQELSIHDQRNRSLKLDHLATTRRTMKRQVREQHQQMRRFEATPQVAGPR
jgi:hypothetical protein